MRKREALCIAVLLALLIPLTGLAHSGRTDKNGGHTNKKTGEYHYHNSGNSSSSKKNNKSSSSSSSKKSTKSSSGSSSSSSSSAAPKSSVIAVTKVEILIASQLVQPDEVIQFQARVYPSDATNPDVSWSSNKPKVATITNKGKVTAIGAGISKITAKPKYGSGTSDFRYIYVTESLTEADFPIHKGSPKSHIATLQTMLVILNDLSDDADGVYGKQTEVAVSKAASRHGMNQDIECDYDLYSKLHSEIEATLNAA